MAPLYEFKCEECTHLETVILTLEERTKPRECPRCGGMAQRIFSETNAFKAFSEYYSKETGLVRTRNQEARSDKKRGRVDVRDAKWFKGFKKEHADQARQEPGKRRYTTLERAKR